MSRIIKAGYVNLQENGRTIKPPPPPRTEADALAERVAQQETQEAYEDLVVAAQQEVANLLDDARRKASNITIEATREAAQLFEQRKKEGFQEGYDAGYNDGHEKAVAEIKTQAETFFKDATFKLDVFYDEARQNRDRVLEETEPKILRLALDIAEKIVAHELESNPESFATMIREALKSLRNETNVTLQLHKSDLKRIAEIKDSLAVPLTGGTMSVALEESPTVAPNGCLIETANGSIDISPQAQMGQIELALDATTDNR